MLRGLRQQLGDRPVLEIRQHRHSAVQIGKVQMVKNRQLKLARFANEFFNLVDLFFLMQ